LRVEAEKTGVRYPSNANVSEKQRRLGLFHKFLISCHRRCRQGYAWDGRQTIQGIQAIVDAITGRPRRRTPGWPGLPRRL